MEAYEKLLDEIEASIQLIPDESEYKEALIKELQNLRHEFESRMDRDFLIEAKIRDFDRRVKDYIDGKIKNPLPQTEITIPRIELDFDTLEAGENLVQKTREERAIEIFKAQLLRISTDENVDAIREFVDLVEEKYEDICKYSRDLEQTIESVRFQIMLKYIQESRFEEAQLYAKTFGTDMRIYIVNRLKDEIDTLIKEGRLEEAEKLNAYIYDDSMQESDMQLWFLIAKIELEEFNEPVKQERIENLPAVQERKSFWTRLNEKREQKKKDKQEAREKNIKVFRIRFDSTNRKNGMNLNDLKRVQKYIMKSANKKNATKFEVILEEGITVIPSYIFQAHNLTAISLPSTLEKIEELAFYRSGLKKVDLSKTKVTELSPMCFAWCESLEEVQLPDELEYIGEDVFKGSGLKKIDLSQTKVTELKDGCFSECEKFEEILLPDMLEHIGANVFYGSRIKRIDMSNTKITKFNKKWFVGCLGEYIRLPKTVSDLVFLKNTNRSYWESVIIDDTPFEFKVIDLSQTEIDTIPEGWFKGCNFLESVSLPSKIKGIGCGAFADSGIRTIDLSKTKIDCIPRDCFKGCSRLERVVVPEDLEEIGKRAFEGSGIEVIDLSMVKNAIKIKDHAFRFCDKLRRIIMSDKKLKQARHLEDKYINNRQKASSSQADDEGEIEF